MERHRSILPVCSPLRFVAPVLAALTLVTATRAEKKLPAWYCERGTLGETLVDSWIELSRITREAWAQAGFVQNPGKTFPVFLEHPGFWSNREITKENREKTYCFPVGGYRKVYVGGVDRFITRLFDDGRKCFAVDDKGNRTLLDTRDFAGGFVSRQDKSLRKHPQVVECEFRLPEGTQEFVIENVQVCEHWLMGWVDVESRIERVANSLEPFADLAALMERALREDPQVGASRNLETGQAKATYGPWPGYREAARRYYWALPEGQQERINELVPDRTKIDRQTFLKIRDQYIHYQAVLAPKIKEYAEIRLGTQVRDFKTLIEATDGVPRSKGLLPRLEALSAQTQETEKAIKRATVEDFTRADQLVGELTRIKEIFELECKLKLTANTLAYVQEKISLPAESKRLDELTMRVAKARPEEIEELLGEIKALRRQILFRHPDLQFAKLLVCKNPPPGPGHMCDQYLGRHARDGKGLFVLTNWLSDAPAEINITAGLPRGYYHHPDLSFDGNRVAFAFCDTTVERNHKRHWIYEAQIDGSGVRQLTGTLSDPMERVGNRKTVVIEDWDPCYLPDGGFAFVSTRSQSYGRCHGGRYVPSFMLYRMNADGGDIRRLSFGEANEWDPAVLPDGRIVYTRWDYINRHDTRFQSLWTTRPDGTGTAHYYGNYTSSPCMIADTQPVPGSQKVVSTAMAHHGYTHGSIILVDVSRGEDGLEPLTVLTPEIPFPEASYDVKRWMLQAPVPMFDSRNPLGLKSRATAMAPYPVNDTLFLCCYAENGRGYGVYLVDTMGGREKVYDGDAVSAAIPVLPRRVPRSLPSTLAEDKKPGTGTLVVRDVYQNRHVDDKHAIDRGSIKSLRVNVILPQPTRVHWKRGDVSNEILKRPLGTVPVNPDGSVALTAPSGVPLQLQALDTNGMAVMTMRSFIYLHEGDTQTCIGCHENRTTSPLNVHEPRVEVRKLRPVPGIDYDDMAFSFTRTIQPVLDRYCIDCHGLGGAAENGAKPRRDFIFSVAMDESQGSRRFDSLPASYRQLVSAVRPRLAHRNGESVTSVPRDYFSPTSKLPQMLRENHHGVELDPDSFERIITWLDLNSQCYGTYLPNREEQREPDPVAEAELRRYVKVLFGEALAAQPLGALVNPAALDESRILRGPLPSNMGGWEIIDNGFKSEKDNRFVRMRALARKAYQPLPCRDLDGTCGHPKCICGNCWIREMVDEGVYRKQLALKLASSEGAEPTE